uniref:Uncharacterized protein n=1 Tax=viral metagenome TaxID=1070528 RepID=A0A6M3JQ09_9ZZZZ
MEKEIDRVKKEKIMICDFCGEEIDGKNWELLYLHPKFLFSEYISHHHHRCLALFVKKAKKLFGIYPFNK